MLLLFFKMKMIMEKKVVSPFEFAIMEVADPEAAKKMRPETNEEKEQRLRKMAVDFAKRIKVKNS